MAIVGITPGATKRFISKSDDPNNPTVWIIGELDAYTMARLSDQFLDIGIEQAEDGDPEKATSSLKNMRMFEWAIEVCRYGIKDWENFKDQSGNDIQFHSKTEFRNGVETSFLDPEILKRVPMNVLQEIATAIRDTNTVSEKEVKNSDVE